MIPSVVFAIVVFNGALTDPNTRWDLRDFDTQAECIKVYETNRRALGLPINNNSCCRWNGNKPCMDRDTAIHIQTKVKGVRWQ